MPESDPEKLNPEQLQAVVHEGSPLLILAGAGSGKTRVITHRIAWLIEEKGVDPGRILAITFTNKAANEMKERVSRQIGLRARAVWVGTFHAMMLRILRQHADLLGYEKTFSVLDTDDQRRILKEAMKKIGLNDKTTPVRYIHQEISKAKNKLIYPQEYEKKAASDLSKRQIAEIFSIYQNELKQNNAMDFDDILALTVFLFEEQPQVLAYYQERFLHLLVDEYQDTNYAQYMLVLMLAQRHKNVFVVGDDDQSIYSFRGANLMNILDFDKDFKGCRIIRLEQNFRSTKTILAAANSVICQNFNRNEKKLWTTEEEGEKIRFYRAYDQNDEASYVANQIKSLMGKAKEGLSGQEIAVLYRVNALARNIESAFRDKGIVYRVYGGLRFYDRKEVRDVVAYLRLITQESDDVALRRIINSPKRGIGATTVELLSSISAREQSSIFAICKRVLEFSELSYAAGKIQLFVRLIEDLQKKLAKNEQEFGFFVKELIHASGLRAEQEALKDKFPLEAISRIENMDELISDAMEFEARLEEEMEELSSYPELLEELEDLSWPLDLETLTARYLERIALYSDLDQEDQEDAVSLMTIHSAKGLEFDTIFVIGANEGLFPGEQSLYSPEELEEERRLAYVALTRAKKRLFITSALSRLLYGQTMYREVSRFIREIPDDLVDEEGGSRKETSSGSDYRQKATRSFGQAFLKNRAEDNFLRSFTGPADQGQSCQQNREKAGQQDIGQVGQQDIRRAGQAGQQATGQAGQAGQQAIRQAGQAWQQGIGQAGQRESEELGKSETRGKKEDFASGEEQRGRGDLRDKGQSRQDRQKGGMSFFNKDQGLDFRLLNVGDQVVHANYGQGEIKKITPLSDDAILEIKFASGVKRFKASMSLLKTLSEE